MKKRIVTCLMAFVMTAAAVGFNSDGKEVNAAENVATKDSVVMYVGSPTALVSGKEVKIDDSNDNVAPYLKDNFTMIPVSFTAKAFGGTSSWSPENKTATISANGKTLSIALGEKQLVVYSAQSSTASVRVDMGTSAEMRGNRVYVPARFIAEALGKKVFYNKGLIVIGGDADKLDAARDKQLLDELAASFSDLKVVGTKEKLVELLGYDPSEMPEYESNDGVYYDTKIAPSAGGVVQNDTMTIQEAPAAAPAPAAAEASEPLMDTSWSADSPADFSQTNTQVQNVDEADIIKTDGEYIYYLRGDKISIVKTTADGKMELMSEITIPNDYNANELFIDKDKIILIGEYYGYFSPPNRDDRIMPLAEPAVGRMAPYPYYSQEIFTRATVYNISDKSAPKEERTVEIDGSYLSARKIGDSVYFIANTYISYGEILPVYFDTALSREMQTIGYDRIRYFPVISDQQFTTIAGFNIGKPNEGANIETFLGAGRNIYMSENNLYIAGSNYSVRAESTEIYKFAVGNSEIVYTQKGSVPGSVLDQFSMDEYDGYFRIATTTNNYSNPSGGSSNNLFILDSSLNTVGKIDNIAPGERIYSVRFMGKRGYMVTFRQVDPLFAMDLSNPREPKILGALKIPGYSDYLHPYDENHLIGFGKDTEIDRYGNAYALGMKIALFDITDMTNPKELFVETIGDRGTDSPLLRNHKALMFSKERGIMAFPVQLNEAVSKDTSSYGEFVDYFAYVYEISLDKGFTLRGKISHLTEEDLLKSSQMYGDYKKFIERILFIRDNLFTASRSKIQVNDINSLIEKGSLEFSE